MLRDGVLHQDANELTCAVPQSYKPETHNLHILKPYYYSEPKETYKDAEDTEENQKRGKTNRA